MNRSSRVSSNGQTSNRNSADTGARKSLRSLQQESVARLSQPRASQDNNMIFAENHRSSKESKGNAAAEAVIAELQKKSSKASTSNATFKRNPTKPSVGRHENSNAVDATHGGRQLENLSTMRSTKDALGHTEKAAYEYNSKKTSQPTVTDLHGRDPNVNADGRKSNPPVQLRSSREERAIKRIPVDERKQREGRASLHSKEGKGHNEFNNSQLPNRSKTSDAPRQKVSNTKTSMSSRARPAQPQSLTQFYDEAEKILAALPSEDDVSAESDDSQKTFIAKNGTPNAYGQRSDSIKIRPGFQRQYSHPSFPSDQQYPSPYKDIDDSSRGRKRSSSVQKEAKMRVNTALPEDVYIQPECYRIPEDEQAERAKYFGLIFNCLNESRAANFAQNPIVKHYLRKRTHMDHDCTVKVPLREFMEWKMELSNLEEELRRSIHKQKNLDFMFADVMGTINDLTGVDDEFLDELNASGEQYADIHEEVLVRLLQKHEWLLTLRDDFQDYLRIMHKRNVQLAEDIRAREFNRQRQDNFDAAEVKRAQTDGKRFERLMAYQLEKARNLDKDKALQRRDMVEKAALRHEQYVRKQRRSSSDGRQSLSKYDKINKPFRHDSREFPPQVAAAISELLPSPANPKRFSSGSLRSPVQSEQTVPPWSPSKKEAPSKISSKDSSIPPRPPARLSTHHPEEPLPLEKSTLEWGDEYDIEDDHLREAPSTLDVPSFVSDLTDPDASQQGSSIPPCMFLKSADGLLDMPHCVSYFGDYTSAVDRGLSETEPPPNTLAPVMVQDAETSTHDLLEHTPVTLKKTVSTLPRAPSRRISESRHLTIPVQRSGMATQHSGTNIAHAGIQPSAVSAADVSHVGVQPSSMSAASFTHAGVQPSAIRSDNMFAHTGIQPSGIVEPSRMHMGVQPSGIDTFHAGTQHSAMEMSRVPSQRSMRAVSPKVSRHHIGVQPSAVSGPSTTHVGVQPSTVTGPSLMHMGTQPSGVSGPSRMHMGTQPSGIDTFHAGTQHGNVDLLPAPSQRNMKNANPLPSRSRQHIGVQPSASTLQDARSRQVAPDFAHMDTQTKASHQGLIPLGSEKVHAGIQPSIEMRSTYPNHLEPPFLGRHIESGTQHSNTDVVRVRPQNTLGKQPSWQNLSPPEDVLGGAQRSYVGTPGSKTDLGHSSSQQDLGIPHGIQQPSAAHFEQASQLLSPHAYPSRMAHKAPSVESSVETARMQPTQSRGPVSQQSSMRSQELTPFRPAPLSMFMPHDDIHDNKLSTRADLATSRQGLNINKSVSEGYIPSTQQTINGKKYILIPTKSRTADVGTFLSAQLSAHDLAHSPHDATTQTELSISSSKTVVSQRELDLLRKRSPVRISPSVKSVGVSPHVSPQPSITELPPNGLTMDIPESKSKLQTKSAESFDVKPGSQEDLTQASETKSSTSPSDGPDGLHITGGCRVLGFDQAVPDLPVCPPDQAETDSETPPMDATVSSAASMVKLKPDPLSMFMANEDHKGDEIATRSDPPVDKSKADMEEEMVPLETIRQESANIVDAISRTAQDETDEKEEGDSVVPEIISPSNTSVEERSVTNLSKPASEASFVKLQADPLSMFALSDQPNALTTRADKAIDKSGSALSFSEEAQAHEEEQPVARAGAIAEGSSNAAETRQEAEDLNKAATSVIIELPEVPESLLEASENESDELQGLESLSGLPTAYANARAVSSTYSLPGFLKHRDDAPQVISPRLAVPSRRHFKPSKSASALDKSSQLNLPSAHSRTLLVPTPSAVRSSDSTAALGKEIVDEITTGTPSHHEHDHLQATTVSVPPTPSHSLLTLPHSAVSTAESSERLGNILVDDIVQHSTDAAGRSPSAMEMESSRSRSALPSEKFVAVSESKSTERGLHPLQAHVLPTPLHSHIPLITDPELVTDVKSHPQASRSYIDPEGRHPSSTTLAPSSSNISIWQPPSEMSIDASDTVIAHTPVGVKETRSFVIPVASVGKVQNESKELLKGHEEDQPPVHLMVPKKMVEPSVSNLSIWEPQSQMSLASDHSIGGQNSQAALPETGHDVSEPQLSGSRSRVGNEATVNYADAHLMPPEQPPQPSTSNLSLWEPPSQLSLASGHSLVNSDTPSGQQLRANQEPYPFGETPSRGPSRTQVADDVYPGRSEVSDELRAGALQPEGSHYSLTEFPSQVSINESNESMHSSSAHEPGFPVKSAPSVAHSTSRQGDIVPSVSIFHPPHTDGSRTRPDTIAQPALDDIPTYPSADKSASRSEFELHEIPSQLSVESSRSFANRNPSQGLLHSEPEGNAVRPEAISSQHLAPNSGTAIKSSRSLNDQASAIRPVVSTIQTSKSADASLVPSEHAAEVESNYSLFPVPSQVSIQESRSGLSVAPSKSNQSIEQNTMDDNRIGTQDQPFAEPDLTAERTDENVSHSVLEHGGQFHGDVSPNQSEMEMYHIPSQLSVEPSGVSQGKIPTEDHSVMPMPSNTALQRTSPNPPDHLRPQTASHTHVDTSPSPASSFDLSRVESEAARIAATSSESSKSDVVNATDNDKSPNQTTVQPSPSQSNETSSESSHFDHDEKQHFEQYLASHDSEKLRRDSSSLRERIISPHLLKETSSMNMSRAASPKDTHEELPHYGARRKSSTHMHMPSGKSEDDLYRHQDLHALQRTYRDKEYARSPSEDAKSIESRPAPSTEMMSSQSPSTDVSRANSPIRKNDESSPNEQRTDQSPHSESEYTSSPEGTQSEKANTIRRLQRV
ncbi:uncharacterized protein LOC129590317 isoform X2 [Paramacrobiotus metropolitanus]|uniref:uncharacterized protein LOC129590317 isoform X2 n=1 Tax=Paramacrobiotus metropolitanus TaxID=2943436 RepID=UPI0024462FB5|nr:uncharacterized protein LOC129590317 isoform X2 [Paramacrobiotus metropolitanus]